jgi:prepilin-type N-terminal cleavage/methylation domain-containing protein
MKRNQGFSLLELMIVVAIMLVIATIAIPSLFKSRQAANQSSAVADLRNLNTAEMGYWSTHKGAFGSIQDLINEGLLDNRYQNVVSGYNIVVDLSPDTLDYTATAIAAAANEGRYDYWTRPDYVIRYSANSNRAPAGLSGEPVQ